MIGGERFAFFRHPGQIRMFALNHLQKKTLTAFSSYPRSAVLSAFLGVIGIVQPQTGFLLLLAMAFVTSLAQEGLDIVKEVHRPNWLGRNGFDRTQGEANKSGRLKKEAYWWAVALHALGEAVGRFWQAGIQGKGKIRLMP